MPRRSDSHYAEEYTTGAEALVVVNKIKQLQHSYQRQAGRGQKVSEAQVAQVALNFLKRFRSWLTKCYNRSCAQWKYYGGQNIGVEQAWLDDPQIFIDWVLSHDLDFNQLSNIKVSRIDTRKGFTSANLKIQE